MAQITDDRLDVIAHYSINVDQWEIVSMATELLNLRGAIKADDERLINAAKKAGVTYLGCDTPDAIADKVVYLQELVKKLMENEIELASELRYAKDDDGWIHPNTRTALDNHIALLVDIKESENE